MNTAVEYVEYIEAGLVLVPIPAGQKGPTGKDAINWNRRDQCVASVADIVRLDGHSVGLAHSYSRTVAVDVDQYNKAREWLASKGVDLNALLTAEDAVQIRSGVNNHAKLLYRLPLPLMPLPSKKYQDDGDVIEFRCGTAEGLTVQDVLPPSIHPVTGKPYEWRGDWRNIPVIPQALLDIWLGLLVDQPKEPGEKVVPPKDWEHIDLESISGLSRYTRALIQKGETRGKRSEAIFGAIKDLIKAGVEDDTICRIMADPDNGISEKALENAHGDHHKAMHWIAGQIPKLRSLVTNEDGRVEIILEELTEDNLALAFAEQHKRNLRYCHTRGSWFAWDDTRWKQEVTLLAFHYARELCRAYNRKQEKSSRTISGVRTAGAVERFAISDRRLAVTEEFWNMDPWLLATPSGTVDLRTGELRNPDPQDHITHCTSIGPETGTPTLWLRFLEETTQGNRELQRFLQQIAGYCLTGITREHALFFFYGPGGNGKGVFVNTISVILGEYATSAPMDSFTASKHDRHPTDLASLAGARMVTASETEEGRAWAESRIKQITGGDPVKARFMRRDFFEYTPEYKLVFLGNHKPVLRNVDDAARRRFNIIPFTHKPVCPDLELSEKLKAEHAQILDWMIRGCLDWQENGLIRPEIVTAATAEYFDEQDLFSQWLEECTEKKSERMGETTSTLFGSWKRYADAAGDSPGTQRSFRDNMRQHGYEYRPHLPNNHNGRGFVGLSLKEIHEAWKPYAD